MIWRKKPTSAALVLIWLLIMGWQVAEHIRVRRAAHATLINRAKDISNTLALVLRSQRLFNIISRERLESALNELIKPGQLNSIALLNEKGAVVISAGTPLDLSAGKVLQQGEHWEAQTVTVMNLVDLGTNMTAEFEPTNSTVPIVLSRSDFPPPNTNRPPFHVREPNEDSAGETNARPSRSHRSESRGTNDFRRIFHRPFWMSETEYQSVIQKQGVHSFVLVMPTQIATDIANNDLWLRSIIGLLTTISVAGFGLAWRNVAKSSELQIRLVRASELNTHLKEMNLAAAGLAHETRNPLNIIRGLAQIISRQGDASPEIAKKSREIIDESDRLTGQLNEFINYSRPREVRFAAVELRAVVTEVVRTLSFDMEEKSIQLKMFDEPMVIQADEPLLRQALFNLILNAIQAVPEGGRVEVRAFAGENSDVIIEVRDNGPGVAAANRAEIFKPYFTTRDNGTGLGLAIVQQIVLAHGWEITCAANEPNGAVFRIAHVKLHGENSNASRLQN
ncbi:MAG: ATP-binding protein [Verrucomicrobiota bacterium]